jgi:uncharacterized membrane protein YhaH (DUF805 family)
MIAIFHWDSRSTFHLATTEGKEPLPHTDSQQYSEMRTVWFSSTNVTLLLFWIITAILVVFTVYVIVRMWRDWSRQSRVLGCGGLAIMIALICLVAIEINDEGFRSHFLSEYVVAVGLFVVGFFAVEQFLDIQRNRSVSSHYLPAITHEVLYNCRALAQSLALIKATLYEGNEILVEMGNPSFRFRHAAWSSFVESGHLPSLPDSRSGKFSNPVDLLPMIKRELVAQCRFAIDEHLDYESIVGWTESFPNDLERGYELLRDAEVSMGKINLTNIPKRSIGLAVTSAFENPRTEEERAFKESHVYAHGFCKAATQALVFSCFVLCEIDELQSELAFKSPTGTLESVAEKARPIVRKVLSRVPRELLWNRHWPDKRD